jgi:predicted transposase YdaD
LAVAALLDAAAAKIAVVKGLAAQGNPELQRREAEARSEAKAEGRAEGKAEGILNLLTARGVAVNEAQRQEILRCRDLDRLDRWLVQAAFVSAAGEFTSEP